MSDQGQGGAQSLAMGSLERGGGIGAERFAGIRLAVRQRAGPGRPGQVRIDRLPVLVPQVSAGAQGHEAAEVFDTADAAEIVFTAEAGVLGLVQQAEQDAELATRGRLSVE